MLGSTETTGADLLFSMDLSYHNAFFFTTVIFTQKKRFFPLCG